MEELIQELIQLKVDNDLDFNLYVIPTICYMVVILARKKSEEECKV